MDFSWLDPVFDALDYDLYSVSFKKDALGSRISIEIEKPGYITFEDCQIVSQEVMEALEALQLDPEPRVEVASAGAERALKTHKNYQNALGKTASIKTTEATYNGTIQSVTENAIQLALKTQTLEIPFTTIEEAHLTLV